MSTTKYLQVLELSILSNQSKNQLITSMKVIAKTRYF